MLRIVSCAMLVLVLMAAAGEAQAGGGRLGYRAGLGIRAARGVAFRQAIAIRRLRIRRANARLRALS